MAESLTNFQIDIFIGSRIEKESTARVQRNWKKEKLNELKIDIEFQE